MSWTRVAIVVVLVAACGDDGTPLVPPGLDGVDDADAAVPVCTTTASPSWWTPAPGETKNWDIQLAAPFNTTAVRTMYELELFDVVPAATVIDYADGDPVTVPAGALAGTIATLHARNPPAIVVCHVTTGALDLGDPDARKFPGFKADPPDAPTPPEAGSVIGWSVQDLSDQVRDLRGSEHGRWTPIMFKRFELAKTIGCDAVEVDRVDNFKKTTGFSLVATEVTAFIGQVSDAVHANDLSAGVRNGFAIEGQIQTLAECYDFGMQDRCAEFNDCNRIGAFGGRGKAMFGLDIRLPDSSGYGVDPATVCPIYAQFETDGVVKAEALDSSFRKGCEI